jgi:putative FmdB family regulatory protein
LEGIVPIYEYRCSTCGFQKEYLRKLSDPLLSVCPECSKKTFGKMLTAAGFQLKGGGWYATDFKNSGARPAAKTAGQNGAAANAESKTETMSESKSEGKGKSEGKSDSKPKARPAAAAAPAAPPSTAKAE